MVLSWNEIRKRAVEFSHSWADAARENADKQTFWNEFFNVFGVPRRRVASFEAPVERLGDRRGSIDLFWKGTLLVEHKSLGKDLDAAYMQATDYFEGLQDDELPKYVIVSDFAKMRFYDLDEKINVEFAIADLHKKVHLFGFIAGYEKQVIEEEDPVNIAAAELMGELHDKLKKVGYADHELELLLVRLLFCVFADDTGIFDSAHFFHYIKLRTKEDGSDLGSQIGAIFQILDTPLEKRSQATDEELAKLPYVNGSLFEEVIPLAFFDSSMRDALLKCCEFDWNEISPAIFGSLFQSVMDAEKRRNIGAHYTSEQNILKLVRSLFLDDLYAEYNRVKGSAHHLKQFHEKLARLKFFDPACGCGNFLIISYREIRKLELEVLKTLYKPHGKMTQGELDISELSKIDVDSMVGIEIEEFPAKIAEVAMWLMDHQMNMRLAEAFGMYYARIPLRKSAKIIHGNALRLDWKAIVPSEQVSYILGNPPFIGKQHRSVEQNQDMDIIFNGVQGAGVLDYVCAWYMKAAAYMQQTKIKAAFVSTNSIAQGEQVGILWQTLFQQYHIKILFSHRPFAWTSEARGKAHVYVVIIGFAAFDEEKKAIYEYEKPTAAPHLVFVENINPYLVDSGDFVIVKRTRPLCKVPEIRFGNMPNDGGHLLMTDEEKNALVSTEPSSAQFIRPLVSAKEYLNNEKRWCVWLVDARPEEIRAHPEILDRVEKVRHYRLQSTRKQTTELAKTPALFGEIRQPESNYMLIPLVSSENRQYIPFGYFDERTIVNNSCACVPDANLYHFGVLCSHMHMVWMRYVCGRLKGDYRYSNEIVYNNFPWPESPTTAQMEKVEACAEAVLTVRKEYPAASLADMYNPLTMPAQLLGAHQNLDRAVDACYRKQGFENDIKRIEYLFDLYVKYSMPFEAIAKKNKKRSTAPLPSSAHETY